MSGPFSALLAIVLLVATLVTYVPALRAGFIWDDDDYILNNPNLRDLAGLTRTWTQPLSLPQWYPLVHTMFWLDYHVWGTSPAGYHLMNVVLHVTGAWLLARLLLRLKFTVHASVLAAIVFALHPVHVESVAWATERKNVLSGVLYLSAAIAYLRFDPSVALERLRTDEEDRRRWRWWAASFVSFVGALLSKSVTATFPAMVLVVVWWKRGRIRLRDVWPLIPFFAAGIAMGATTAWLEKHHVGADGREFTLSLFDRILLAGRVPWFYLGKILFPHHPAFIYPRWSLDAGSVRQLLFPLATIATIALLWAARRRIGRGPLATALFFGGTLFPVLGFFNLYPFRYSYVADHFQYLASIGPIALIAACAAKAAARLPRRIGPPLFLGVGVVIALGLSLLSWCQSGMYRNLETLWRETISRNPDAWLAHGNLGVLLMDRGQNAEAIDCFQRAIALYEGAPRPHYNLGQIYRQQGRPGDAEREFQRALQLDPAYAKPYAVLAEMCQDAGRSGDALELYGRAIRLDPAFMEARIKYGAALVDAGHLDLGLDQFQEVLRRQPANLDAAYDSGYALLQVGHPSEALVRFQLAVQIDPACVEAWQNAGIALEATNRPQQAAAAFERVLAIDPTFASAKEELRRLRSAKSRESPAPGPIP